MLNLLGGVDEFDCDLSEQFSCLDDENDGLGIDHLYTYAL